MRINHAFLKNFVHRARIDIQLLGKPSVGFLLSAQLLANELPDVWFFHRFLRFFTQMPLIGFAGFLFF